MHDPLCVSTGIRPFKHCLRALKFRSLFRNNALTVDDDQPTNLKSHGARKRDRTPIPSLLNTRLRFVLLQMLQTKHTLAILSAYWLGHKDVSIV